MDPTQPAVAHDQSCDNVERDHAQEAAAREPCEDCAGHQQHAEDQHYFV